MIVDDFVAADSPEDGKLDFAEYTIFTNKLYAREEAKGAYWNSMYMKEEFDFMNRIEEGDGVTLQAWMGFMNVFM